MLMKEIEIHTDGSSLGPTKDMKAIGDTTKFGGGGIVLLYKDTVKEVSNPYPNYTNNQAELCACVDALSLLKIPCKVDLFSDSEYVRKGITTWIHGWRKRNWKTQQGEDVKNKDLWLRLDHERNKHEVSFHWEKGHSDNKWNNVADRLAGEASLSLKEEYLL